MKKVITTIAAAGMILTLFGIGASAMTSSESAEQIVSKANAKIAQEVEKAQASAKDDVQELVEKTEAIAERAIDETAKLGVTVLCEKTVYLVDGQIVLIDPLKVAY